MTNEQNDNRSVARDDAQRDGAGKHIIYKSRIVSPKVEKPEMDKDWLSPLEYSDEFDKYTEHLESLWPDGIECSAELLERFKDGDEVVEGKDFKISRVGRCFGRYSGMVEIAIPTDAVEEGDGEITEHDMTWLLRLKAYFGENSRTQFEHSAYHFLDNLLKNFNHNTN